MKQLSEDIKTLQLNFTMLYIIHKLSVLIRIAQNLKRF